MKRLIAILLMFSLPCICGGQLNQGARHRTVVAAATTVTYAGKVCATSYSSGSSVACTLTGLSAGQTIYLSVVWYTFSNTLTSVTDSNGTTSSVVGPNNDIGNDFKDSIYVVKNTASGSHTLTANFSSITAYPIIYAVVLSGASTTSPTDSVSTPNTGGGQPVITNNVTTSVNNEFILGFCDPSGGLPVTAGTTPQVMTGISTGYTNYVPEYGTAATAGSNYAEWTFAGGEYWIATLIAVH